MNIIKLARNIFILGLIAAVTLVTAVLITPHDANNYLAAASDKYRMLHSVASPRIILVGGSNVAFSLDSAKISDHFDLPVVNMGLHVDLGLRYMLNEVGPALRNGDIVIIFPEYEHFSGLPLDGRPTELGSVIKFCPECITGISTPAQMFNVLVGITQMEEGDILRSINNSKAHEKVYFRRGFDQYGDMVAHLKQNDTLKLNNHVSEIKILSPNPAVDLLNSFYQSHHTGNVRIFVMFPAIPVNEYQDQKDKFSALNEFVKAKLEIPVIGIPQDFAYPVDSFYDTVYHMNRTGREEHTDDVIYLLSPVLQK